MKRVGVGGYDCHIGSGPQVIERMNVFTSDKTAVSAAGQQ